MKIGFCTFSLPFKWTDSTVIAHNRIWAYLVDSLYANGHSIHIQNRVDSHTSTKLRKYKAEYLTKAADLDVLFVFCGPYMPMTAGGITHTALNTIKDFSGRVIYITCDYLLQFNFSVKRYGPLLAGWGEDALVRNKDWRYILHGSFNHHFKTDHQKEKMLSVLPKSAFHTCELNMSGIPMGEVYTRKDDPRIDLLYCGAYRKGREKFFEKYFCQEESARWHISTSKSNIPKFQSLDGMNSMVRGAYPMGVWRFINDSCVQIIASDDNDKNAPLPTRFWEACAARTLVVFDQSYKVPNLGYDPPMAGSAEELAMVIAHCRKHPKWRDTLIQQQDLLIDGFDPYNEWEVSSWLK